MKDFTPKIVSSLHNYSKEQCKKDILSGILVAIIALPLSIAFALGCGLSPERGIYASIISSIIVGLLGGSRVQISGPTGAFIIIIQSVLKDYDLTGLMMATILAGIILILMGFFKIGKLIKFIPTPIVTGFTGGVAITIFTLELKDFLGFSSLSLPANFFGKWIFYLTHLNKINISSLLIGVIGLAVIVLWPKINKTIPSSFAAIVICTLVSLFPVFDCQRLGEIPIALQLPSLPVLPIHTMFSLVKPAFSIALLIALQALFSAVMTDGMINSKHNPDTELVAHGVSNVVLGFFALLPSTGGVIRSVANAKNGGRTPVAAIIQGLTLLFFILFCMPLIKLIPLSALAAILMITSYNMFNIKEFLSYKKAPLSDALILITSCILTFTFHLIIAIEVGMILTLISFVKRMSEESNVYQWKASDSKDVITDSPLKEVDIKYQKPHPVMSLKKVPDNTLVYELSGPLFFASVNNILQIPHTVNENTDYIIVRMKGVTAIDITAIKAFRELHRKLHLKDIQLIFSHVMEQPMLAMERAGFLEEIGEENICDTIDLALHHVHKNKDKKKKKKELRFPL